MTQSRHNFLVRTATGIVFVTLVLAAMLLGRTTYAALLLCVTVGCVLEFLRIARGPAQKSQGSAYILLAMVAMWFFPTLGTGMTSAPIGVWDERIAPGFMIVVWANDVCAYLVGITCGRHKMSPRLSPHKSWEGFAGGIVGAACAAALVGRCVGGEIWLWTAFGVVTAGAAVAGDFAESWFKRAAGVKDSGRILPGHGGLLDRFDATLGAVPAAFLFFVVTYLVG